MLACTQEEISVFLWFRESVVSIGFDLQTWHMKSNFVSLGDSTISGLICNGGRHVLHWF